MDKKRICIVGHFASGHQELNGQTVKTKTIANELERQLGKNEIVKIDTRINNKIKMISLFFQVIFGMKKCENTIILPAQNGILFLAPLLCVGKLFFQSNIHYIVIGGWLPGFVKDRFFLKECLKRFDGIYVETSIMKQLLEQQDFSNICIMPNCKNINIVREEELFLSQTEPYRLCTFSRVMKEKGIEDAIQAIKEINEKYGRKIFCLDIYGQIDAAYENEFVEMQKKFPTYIRYCGSVGYNQSTSILKDYCALLFPTHFYTEGIPGTVIDAYASGIPVIAARWESFDDLIEQGKNGLGYQFGNYTELVYAICHLVEDKVSYMDMKRSCIEKARDYTTEKVIANFLKRLQG